MSVTLPAGPPAGHELIDLTTPPRLADAYRAALREGAASAIRRPTALRVPHLAVAHGPVSADAARLTGYQHLLGLPGTDELPAGYVHVLGFPEAMALMTHPDFPLPVLGMVHIANTVVQQRPVRFPEALRFTAWAEDLRPHRRGTQIDVRLLATAGDDAVWLGTSTYLARGVRPPDAAETPESAEMPAADAAEAPEREQVDPGPSGRHVWRLPGDTGRRYAAVSGDRNPIHTSRMGARLLGFPRPIAHGMYTAARALAELPRQPRTFEWTAAFAKPVLLPGTVVLRFAAVPGGWSYVVHSRSGATHLTGDVRGR